MIKMYEEGSWFGEISIVKKCQRTASVKAVTDCNVLALKASTVRRFIKLFEEKFDEQYYMYE